MWNSKLKIAHGFRCIITGTCLRIFSTIIYILRKIKFWDKRLCILSQMVMSLNISKIYMRVVMPFTYFRLPLASNWLKFYRDSSKYPYRDSSEVSNNYRYRHFGGKFNVIHQNQSIFLSSNRKFTFYRHASKITVNVIWQEFLPWFVMKVPPLPPSSNNTLFYDWGI